MKKNLSLITALLLTAPLFADNLNDAFANGKVKGEIKSEYSNSNFLGATSSDDIGVVGGSLGYTTGDFYGFNAGATFQASHVIAEDNDHSIFARDLDASGAVLSELYLQYKLSNTSAKAGRQFIYTPLISTAINGKSSESVVKDSFEAYLLTNTDIPDTVITAGYVDKYQGKTRGNGDIGKFEQYEDGAYTLYVKNNSIENLEIQAQYLNIDSIARNKDIQNYYLQADYKLGNQTLSAQYLLNNNESADDGQIYGVKATGPLGISNLAYVLAFNSNTKKADATIGAGAGTDDTLFTAMPVNGGGVPARGKTDTLVGGLIVPILDVTTVAYAGYSWSDEHALGDVYALGAMAIYPFYKDFLLKVNYEHVNIENTIVPAGIEDRNTDVARVYLSYNF